MTEIWCALSRTQRRRKAAVALFACGLLVLAAISSPAWGVEGLWARSIATAGMLLMAASVLGRIWCALYIAGRKKVFLVMEGPYSLSRNPLYVFSAIGAVGFGAQSGALALAILAGAAYVLIFTPVIRKEESFLEQTLGAPYVAYRDRTPRWASGFLRPTLWQDEDLLEIEPSRIVRAGGESALIFLATPVFGAIALAQAYGGLPVWIPLL